MPTAADAREVAEVGRGPRVRKQPWTEFGAEHPHARLSVLPDDALIFSGEIAIAGIPELTAAFGRVGHRRTIGLHDPDSGEVLADRP